MAGRGVRSVAVDVFFVHRPLGIGEAIVVGLPQVDVFAAVVVAVVGGPPPGDHKVRVAVLVAVLEALAPDPLPPVDLRVELDIGPPDARRAQAAEAEASAKRLETEGALVPAAKAWERAFTNAVDADTRGHAAFRGQKAYREAARSTERDKLLCDAQRVVLTNLERPPPRLGAFAPFFHLRRRLAILVTHARDRREEGDSDVEGEREGKGKGQREGERDVEGEGEREEDTEDTEAPMSWMSGRATSRWSPPRRATASR